MSRVKTLEENLTAAATALSPFKFPVLVEEAEWDPRNLDPPSNGMKRLTQEILVVAESIS